MKIKSLVSIITVAIIFMACKNDKKSSTTEEVVEMEKEVEKKVVDGTNAYSKMSITLEPKSDSQVTGTVTFEQTENGVSMVAEMTGLTPGSHAIHIHESADCSSPDGKSTGGHWNPTAQPHGKWGEESGYHKGDIGNFEVGEDGMGSISLTTDQWCIGCGDPAKDILGKAIIVHQGADDFTSQPSGAAGARISCAGIIE
jgi:Cu-Zn family superoxide dismutase